MDWPYYRFLTRISDLWSSKKTIFTKQQWEDKMCLTKYSFSSILTVDSFLPSTYSHVLMSFLQVSREHQPQILSVFFFSVKVNLPESSEKYM